MNEATASVNNAEMPTEGLVNTQQAPQAPVEPERTFRQADIDRLIVAAKADAHEKGKRAALAEMQRAQASAPMAAPDMQMPAFVAQPSHQQQTLGGMPQMSQQDIDRMIQEGIQRAHQQMQANQFGQQFEAKVYAGRDKYPDYDAKIAALNLTHPDVLPLLHGINAMDNVPDLLHDFHENPAKFANLVQIGKLSPDRAFKEMQNWAQSIKLNQNAANAKTAQEPLSHLQASNVGTGSGSPSTDVNDFRQASYLKV